MPTARPLNTLNPVTHAERDKLRGWNDVPQMSASQQVRFWISMPLFRKFPRHTLLIDALLIAGHVLPLLPSPPPLPPLLSVYVSVCPFCLSVYPTTRCLLRTSTEPAAYQKEDCPEGGIGKPVFHTCPGESSTPFTPNPRQPSQHVAGTPGDGEQLKPTAFLVYVARSWLP